MSEIKEVVLKDFYDAETIDNFRLDVDGSLIKREGYSYVADFGSTIRGVLPTDNATYVVAGDELMEIRSDGNYPEYIGYLGNCTFDSDDDPVLMFIDLGILYIIGGGRFYSYNIESGALTDIEGYVPLVRKNATKTSSGTAYEKPNLITSRVRMSFISEQSSTPLTLWGDVGEVYGVYYDGVPLPEDEYNVNYRSTSTTVTIYSRDYFTNSTEMVVEYELLSVDSAANRRSMFNAKKLFLYEDSHGKRILLYDTQTIGEVFTSYYTSADSLYPENCYEYFIEGEKFTVGNGSKPVCNITSFDNRNLVMTTDAIYELKATSRTIDGFFTQKFSCDLVTPELGISQNSGTVLFDGELYLCNDLGLCRTAFSPETGEFYSVPMDFAPYAAPPKSEYNNIRLFLHRPNNELWCCYDDHVAVYNLKFKKWYSFSGFTANSMLLYNKNAAFYSYSTLYSFNSDSYTDNGMGFSGVYKSKNIDFGNIFAKKTIFGFGAAFDRYDGAKLSCVLKNDKDTEFSIDFEAEHDCELSPIVMDTHARLGNTAYVSCTIIAPDDSPPVNVRQIMFRYRVEND